MTIADCQPNIKENEWDGRHHQPKPIYQCKYWICGWTNGRTDGCIDNEFNRKKKMVILIRAEKWTILDVYIVADERNNEFNIIFN